MLLFWTLHEMGYLLMTSEREGLLAKIGDGLQVWVRMNGVENKCCTWIAVTVLTGTWAGRVKAG
jgi:hypothetical protein